MKVLKEVEVSDAEIDNVIVQGIYQKEREEFYRYGNDHYSFQDFDSWRASKYYEMKKVIEKYR